LRRPPILVLAALAVALSGAAPSLAHTSTTSASPHVRARALLGGCLAAINRVPITAVRSNTPLVPRRSQQAQRANRRCDISTKIDDLAYRHPRDKALAHAYTAASNLQLGIGDYVQYLNDVAFGHQNRTELRRAIAEVRNGKRLAPRALRELR
jgi:hypothetical protein